jgi:hypothetical protein
MFFNVVEDICTMLKQSELAVVPAVKRVCFLVMKIQHFVFLRATHYSGALSLCIKIITSIFTLKERWPAVKI